MIRQDLTDEQNLLLLTARRTFTAEEKEEICRLLSAQTVNLFEVFKLAMYHKVATLCWYNMNEIYQDMRMPKYLNSMLRYFYYDLADQNRLFADECDTVISKLSESGVTVIPVKGAYLLTRMYQPFGIRYMGDMDFLVRKEDGKRLEAALGEIGYIKGNFNFKRGEVQPVSRAEDIKWKMSMSNFFPFRKVTGNEKEPVFKLDFRFSLDDSLDTAAVNEIVDCFEQRGTFTPAHVITHLCTHFYGEAKHTSTIFMSKDLNIIKLCDIREYVIQFASAEDLRELVSFSKKHGLEQQIYYTFFCLEQTYADPFCKEVMEQLGIEDLSFLRTYGEKTTSENLVSTKSFTDLLFDCDNKSMLNEKPKFLI